MLCKRPTLFRVFCALSSSVLLGAAVGVVLMVLVHPDVDLDVPAQADASWGVVEALTPLSAFPLNVTRSSELNLYPTTNKESNRNHTCTPTVPVSVVAGLCRSGASASEGEVVKAWFASNCPMWDVSYEGNSFVEVRYRHGEPALGHMVVVVIAPGSNENSNNNTCGIALELIRYHSSQMQAWYSTRSDALPPPEVTFVFIDSADSSDKSRRTLRAMEARLAPRVPTSFLWIDETAEDASLSVQLSSLLFSNRASYPVRDAVAVCLKQAFRRTKSDLGIVTLDADVVEVGSGSSARDGYLSPQLPIFMRAHGVRVGVPQQSSQPRVVSAVAKGLQMFWDQWLEAEEDD
eukprot:PhM_4_TR1171/c0_g1_i1/m.14200